MNKKNNGLKICSCIALLLIQAGCARVSFPSKTVPAVKQQQPKSLQREAAKTPVNSYYYYLMAEMNIKQGHLGQAAAALKKAIARDPGAPVLKKELALIYIQQDKKQAALSLVDDLLKKNPDDVEALIIDASIRQAEGETDYVKKAYERVIKLDPDRQSIYIVLGRLYIEDEMYHKAINVLDRLVKRFPDAYTGYYYIGKAYKSLGETKKAIDAFNQSLEIEPALIEPRVELIQIYQKKNKPQNMIEQYEDILEYYPENIPASIELGLLYHKTGKTRSEKAVLSDLGKKSLTDKSVTDIVIQNLIAQNRYKDAVIVLKGMLQGAPESADIHYLLGATYYLDKQYKAALPHLLSVGTKSRFHIDAAMHAAVIYDKLGKPEAAIDILRKTLKPAKDKDKVKLIPILTSFYVEQNRYADAVKLLKQGISIDKRNTDLHYQLGMIYDKMGNSSGAIDQMKTVIRLSPNNADALNYLGYTYADQGVHLDDAERFVKKALGLKPDNGYILDSMGWVYYKKGELDKAQMYLEKAVKQVPDDPVILEHLGDIYLKGQQREKALDTYQRALKNAKGSDKTEIQEKIDALQK